jgi:hypothetical protein
VYCFTDFSIGVFGIYAAGQQDKDSKIEKYP